MSEIDCLECVRGILCPDWDADNHCSAGIQKTLIYKLKEVFDAIELGHKGHIYDTGDYDEVTDEITNKIENELDKLKAIDAALTKKYAHVGHLRDEIVKILECQSIARTEAKT